MSSIYRVGSLIAALSFLGAAAEAVSSFPVVIKGHENLRGVALREIQVYKLADKALSPARFQVDELNRFDEFVLAEGLPFTARSDDGFFDENDELVFLSEELSDCPGVRAAKFSQSSKAWVVEVLGKDKLSKGCVLVAVAENAKATASLPLAVTFNREAGEVSSDQYRYAFPKKHPALLGELWLKSKGSEHPLIKSSQFLFRFELPWYLPNVSLTQDNFSSEIESWQSGPVRTIVAVGVKFRKLLTMFNLHMFSELVFYPSAFQIPTVMEMRFDASKYLRRGSGIGYAVTLAEKAKLTTTLPNLPDDGPNAKWDSGSRASDIEVLAANADFGHAYFSMHVKLSPELKANSLPPYFIPSSDFGNNKKAKDWTWLENLDGDFGVFVDTSGIQRGTYDFGLDLFLSSEADQSIIADYESMTTTWLAIASH